MLHRSPSCPYGKVSSLFLPSLISTLFFSARVCTQSGAKHLFSVQTDSSPIIAHTWMVVQAEEASLAKLCRKLVVIILL